MVTAEAARERALAEKQKWMFLEKLLANRSISESQFQRILSLIDASVSDNDSESEGKKDAAASSSGRAQLQPLPPDNGEGEGRKEATDQAVPAAARNTSVTSPASDNEGTALDVVGNNTKDHGGVEDLEVLASPSRTRPPGAEEFASGASAAGPTEVPDSEYAWNRALTPHSTAASWSSEDDRVSLGGESDSEPTGTSQFVLDREPGPPTPSPPELEGGQQVDGGSSTLPVEAPVTVTASTTATAAAESNASPQRPPASPTAAASGAATTAPAAAAAAPASTAFNESPMVLSSSAQATVTQSLVGFTAGTSPELAVADPQQQAPEHAQKRQRIEAVYSEEDNVVI